MLFLTHLYFAQQVHGQLKVKDLKDYYLGAVLPDIRYFSGIPRPTTHRPLPEIDILLSDKALSDLRQGVKVHLSLDELVHTRKLYVQAKQSYPRLLQRLATPQFLNIVFELYALDYFRRQPTIQLSTTYHPELEKLSISQPDLIDFATKINSILQHLTIKQVENVIFSTARLRQSKKIGLYRLIGKVLLNLPPIKSYFTSRAKPHFLAFEKDFIASIMTTNLNPNKQAS